jgi:hypothetical protein
MAKRRSIIPGLSFSWKRALGISGVRQKLARQIGVPTTRQGAQRKIGASLLGFLFSLLSGERKR